MSLQEFSKPGFQEYKGMQSVLNVVLGKYQAKGFRLVLQGDHTVALYFRDDLVGTFSQTGATQDSIQETCRDWLEFNRID